MTDRVALLARARAALRDADEIARRVKGWPEVIPSGLEMIVRHQGDCLAALLEAVAAGEGGTFRTFEPLHEYQQPEPVPPLLQPGDRVWVEAVVAQPPCDYGGHWVDVETPYSSRHVWIPASRVRRAEP